MSAIIKLEGLSKKYGSNLVLDNLSLDVNEGQVLGYLGPNGAGKTTTIKIILGLIKQSGGQASIFGRDSQKDRIAIHKQLAYVPSEPAYWPNLTGRETLYLLSKLRSNYDYVYQEKLLKDFDFDPNKKIREYSRGNRQKIGLISAFSTRAPLLIMDEPSTGLDPLMDQVFRQMIKAASKAGQTIFLSSHLLEEVEALCDQIAILKSGKLIEAGSLHELTRLAAIKVEATFKTKPPKVSHLKGVSSIETNGHKLSCQVNGSIDALFKELLKASPINLYSRPASLEDLFLSVYENK